MASEKRLTRSRRSAPAWRARPRIAAKATTINASRPLRAGRPLKRRMLSHSIAPPATNSEAARTAIARGRLGAKAPNTTRPRPASAVPADHQGSAALSRLRRQKYQAVPELRNSTATLIRNSVLTLIGHSPHSHVPTLAGRHNPRATATPEGAKPADASPAILSAVRDRLQQRCHCPQADRPSHPIIAIE